MRITDLLKKEGIKIGASAVDKADAIDQLIALHEVSGNLKDVSAYKEGILARESQSTTAIGMEIAIPHAKSEAVAKPALTAMTLPEGVDYGAPDGNPCKLLFMIAATTDGDVHLEVLARMMQMLMDQDFTNDLKQAKTPEEFLEIIDRKEKEKFPEEVKEEKMEEKKGYRILAVTACPTGIAHTYMAAEALTKAGEELGVSIKVETNGSGGAKNVLTKKEIEECDGIIIAADKNVEMARFNGKPVVKTPVSDGIHKPAELINKVLNGEAPVFHSTEEASSADFGDDESFGRKIYKHLMNGVSHMLPFVVGGGVLIAIGFLIDTILGNATVNGAANGAFGFTSFAASIPFWIGKVAFGMMLPILSGYIAMSIADRPGLLPGMLGGIIAANGYTFKSMFEAQNLVGDGAAVSGFLGALLAGFIAGLVVNLIKKAFNWLPKAMDGIKPVFIYPLLGSFCVGAIMCLINPVIGLLNTAVSNGLTSLGTSSRLILSIVLAGMMAIDMGGPFNKAAYVFGTAAIADGNTWIMAAVMIGGMVPPIAIALSTTFNKKKWTAEELKSGPVNYLMGLCFITEGAIPYAASDPLRVIPSCIVGSAAAGALTALFKVTCPAPHGGIFTFIVCGNPLLYVVALIGGSVVGALMLAILKKPAKK